MNNQTLPAMRPWVRLIKDGDRLGIDTNVRDADKFWDEFVNALIVAFSGRPNPSAGVLKGDRPYTPGDLRAASQVEIIADLKTWLRQAFSIAAHLHGYKAEVAISHVLSVGQIFGNTNPECFSSLRLSEAEAEQQP